jgi:hypothetical protein
MMREVQVYQTRGAESMISADSVPHDEFTAEPAKSAEGSASPREHDRSARSRFPARVDRRCGPSGLYLARRPAANQRVPRLVGRPRDSYRNHPRLECQFVGATSARAPLQSGRRVHEDGREIGGGSTSTVKRRPRRSGIFGRLRRSPPCASTARARLASHGEGSRTARANRPNPRSTK